MNWKEKDFLKNFADATPLAKELALEEDKLVVMD
jgi:hypothetical protein